MVKLMHPTQVQFILSVILGHKWYARILVIVTADAHLFQLLLSVPACVFPANTDTACRAFK